MSGLLIAVANGEEPQARRGQPEHVAVSVRHQLVLRRSVAA